MSLEDLCIWRKTALEGGTTFADVRDPSHDGYRCLHECIGYDHACTKYVTIATLKLRREIKEKYPVLFPVNA